MMRSLLIKLAMLGVTLGSLLWVASVTPVTKVMPPQAHLPSPAPSSPVKPAAVQSDQPSLASPLPVTKPARPVEHTVVQEKAFAHERSAYQGAVRQVDLNQATVADLEALPGIGPKLAQRVIDHRDERGPFHSVDDLRHVRGIGRKTFERLRSHVLVTDTRSQAGHKGTL